MPVADTTPFECPNCDAQYKLVRVETEGLTFGRDESLPDQHLSCRVCEGPLHGREGRFILKYFLVGRPRRGPLG
jgi:hypothetical protein